MSRYKGDKQWMPLLGTGLAVRMALLNEAYAERNHRQSLDRLAERGGLAPCEALAVAEMRLYEKVPEEYALKRLAEMSRRVGGRR